MMGLMAAPVEELVAEGRAALRTGDAATARRVLERALRESPSGEVTEGLARVAYLELDFARAIAGWEEAYAVYRHEADVLGAVRVARALAKTYGLVVGDYAVSSGWLARAQTLLGASGESPEAGWVTLHVGMFEGDRATKEQRFRESLRLARRFGDTDLEVVSLAYLGASLVYADRTEEGMVLLDEALAAVAGSEVDDFSVLEDTFCQLFAACERAHDVGRAEQWIRVGEAIAARRHLPAVSAFCRTHYGGILTAAGRWPEADAALTEAVRLWGLGQRAYRGAALIRLADLRVRQGRFEEAEQLLTGLEHDGDAARPLAAMLLARGETARARDVLEGALAGSDPSPTGAAPLLALIVDVELAAGRVEAARAAAEGLAARAASHPSPYLDAVAALARGRVCVAAGDGDPHACLREAVAGFSRAEMPVELARCRLELAGASATDNPELALAEARAALEAFERLEAARDADAAAAMLRSLGVRATTARASGGPLTKREAEVLDLLGHGCSNPEISERLYISRKTVEHHVGNILAKLGLRSRSEAAAYASRFRPGGE